MKRIFCIAFISIICSFSFLTGYCSLCTVPVYGAQDQWEAVTSNEQLADAFRAYCKSRNTVIDGSLLDAVTSFTTTTFNNLCNTLGIDVTLLQAELQRSYTGSGYKYAFSQLGLSTYNRIFAEFLQNNDLSVGDSVDDKQLYDGEYFNYGEYNCLIWTRTDTDLGATNYPDSRVLVRGDILTDGSFFKNLYDSNITTYQYSFLNQNISISFRNYLYRLNNYGICGSVAGRAPTFNHGTVIFKNTSNNKYYLGTHYEYYLNNNHSEENMTLYSLTFNDDSTVHDCNIYITTNNQTINNETVINEGDTYIIDSDGQPDNGGSGDNSDDDWNPVLPDVPGAGSDPSGGNTIDWPDLDLPDFALPNFSLGDLRLKFPFSIPFDIVSILGVINASPVAPVIQEDIPIRIDLMNVDYTIPINLDMSDSLYDNFAVLVRAVEFIGFCIGLIHLTIRLVKG